MTPGGNMIGLTANAAGLIVSVSKVVSEPDAES